ncbi:MAG TPA: PQQ-binding-like beta-propeller repeat protein [Myxococcales bacterium]|nr:PQQ-binding-like beta-propeller repeat protein [Myxococcales bacterium]
MILLALLAFSWTPGEHRPRPPPAHGPRDPSFFVGEMLHIVPQGRLPFAPSETATPVLDSAQTRMYIGTRDGKVRCRFRGQTAWVFQARGAVLASPLVDGETLYVAGGDGWVYALNRFTGAVRWQVDLKEELTTQPTASEGRLFVMSSEQSVTALDMKDGKRLWKFHRDPPGGFTIRGDAQPRIAHGSVFVAFAEGTVAALQPKDGVGKWMRQVSGTGDYLDVDWIDAPEAENRIYVASAKAGVVALDADTGVPAWTYPLAGANHVTVEGSRVVAGGRGELVAIDRATGNKLWSLPLGKDKYSTQPVAMQGIVLVALDRGALMGVDLKTGALRSGFDPGSGFSQPVFAVPGVAYILSNAGSLISLGLLP